MISGLYDVAECKDESSVADLRAGLGGYEEWILYEDQPPAAQSELMLVESFR